MGDCCISNSFATILNKEKEATPFSSQMYGLFTSNPQAGLHENTVFSARYTDFFRSILCRFPGSWPACALKTKNEITTNAVQKSCDELMVLLPRNIYQNAMSAIINNGNTDDTKICSNFNKTILRGLATIIVCLNLCQEKWKTAISSCQHHNFYL